MNLTILGSAACEGIPALWCECPVCREAARRGGRDIRRRCSYRIDDHTLVDFGPDGYLQNLEFGTDLTKIDRLLFTHFHCDHFFPVDFLWRKRNSYFSHTEKYIDIHAPRLVFDMLLDRARQNGFVRSLDELQIRPHEVLPGEAFESGPLRVLPLAANHAPDSGAVFYAIECGGKRVIIANDTGYPEEASLKLLENYRAQCAILECTVALNKSEPEPECCHMNLATSVLLRDELRKRGALEPDAPVWLNHFSHNGFVLHDEFTQKCRPHDLGVAYDGLKIEL